MITFTYISPTTNVDAQVLSTSGKEPISMQLTNSNTFNVFTYLNSITGASLSNKKQTKIANSVLQQSFTSEYNFKWKTNSKYYDSFSLKGISNNKQVAGYETTYGKKLFNVKIGETRQSVEKKYGQPLVGINKNGTKYIQKYVNSYNKKTHGTYYINNKYVTFFYDTYNANKVRSISWVTKNQEDVKKGYFAQPSTSLRNGYENLMVELINQTRVAEGLKPLIYTPSLNNIARKHSNDMVTNNYFAHKNLQGDSARERMIKGGMRFQWYGENLAYGQYSAIYAHEALMNSKGHRNNILRERFTHVFVGVAFKKNGSPYFTINFYQK